MWQALPAGTWCPDSLYIHSTQTILQHIVQMFKLKKKEKDNKNYPLGVYFMLNPCPAN